jgi:hypothetical protein
MGTRVRRAIAVLTALLPVVLVVSGMADGAKRWLL